MRSVSRRTSVTMTAEAVGAQDWGMAGAGKEERRKFHLTGGRWRDGESSAVIVDTDSASHSTSSTSPREDKELHNKDDVDAGKRPFSTHICKMKDTVSFGRLEML
jgi:hypothetical protein